MGRFAVLICSSVGGAGIAVTSIIARKLFGRTRNPSETNYKKRQQSKRKKTDNTYFEQNFSDVTNLNISSNLVEFTIHSSGIQDDILFHEDEFSKRWMTEDAESQETSQDETAVIAEFIPHSSFGKPWTTSSSITRPTPEVDIEKIFPERNTQMASSIATTRYQSLWTQSVSQQLVEFTTHSSTNHEITENLGKADKCDGQNTSTTVSQMDMDLIVHSSEYVLEEPKETSMQNISYKVNQTKGCINVDESEKFVGFNANTNLDVAQNALYVDQYQGFLLPPCVPDEFENDDSSTEETETASITPDDYPGNPDDELLSEDYYENEADNDYMEDSDRSDEQFQGGFLSNFPAVDSGASPVGPNKSVSFLINSEQATNGDIVHRYKSESPVFGSQIHSHSPSSKSPIMPLWKPEQEENSMFRSNPLLGVLQPPLIITRRPLSNSIQNRYQPQIILDQELIVQKEGEPIEVDNDESRTKANQTISELPSAMVVTKKNLDTADKVPPITVAQDNTENLTTCEATALAEYGDETPSLAIEMPSFTACSESLIEGPNAVISALKTAQTKAIVSSDDASFAETNDLEKSDVIKSSILNTIQNNKTSTVNSSNNTITLKSATAKTSIETLIEAVPKTDEILTETKKPALEDPESHEMTCPCLRVGSSSVSGVPHGASEHDKMKEGADGEKENSPKGKDLKKQMDAEVVQEKQGRGVFSLPRRASRRLIERNSSKLSRIGEKIKSLPRRTGRKYGTEN